jgi:excisionase family DNA binding protein
MAKQLETVKQFAERTGFAESTVRQFVNERRIRHVRIGRRFLIPEGAFEEFIARNTVEVDPCQDETKGQSCNFETVGTPTTSPGQRVVAAASARQARQIGSLLKRGSQNSSADGGARAGLVIPLKS